MVRVGQLVYIQAQLSVSILGAMMQVYGHRRSACVPAPGMAMYTVVLASPLWSQNAPAPGVCKCYEDMQACGWLSSNDRY